MKVSVEGIMYPAFAAKALKPWFSSLPASSPLVCAAVAEVPHCSWTQSSFGPYSEVFSRLKGGLFSNVFVLAPLHKGPVSFDSEQPTVYVPLDGYLSGSDWSIRLSVDPVFDDLIVRSDDVCSEEMSLEVIAPFLGLVCPAAPVSYMVADSSGAPLRSIVEILRRDYPSALVLVSDNGMCDCNRMWKEALGEDA